MSAAEEEQVKSVLLNGNDNYRHLVEDHHRLDHRLHELLDKQYLSTNEQLEEVTIKKRKLALKDQMEQMAREYARGHSFAS
jgi:uncharacterized protein YdcH (DUF465 family)